MKRTESAASRATSVRVGPRSEADDAGRLGRVDREGQRLERDPVEVANARHDQPIVDVGTERRSAGTEGVSGRAARARLGRTTPSVGGSSRIAPSRPSPDRPGRRTRRGTRSWSRRPSRSAAVALADAVVTSRVRKTARAGRASGWPDRASAPAWTVTVWSVPTAQRSRGDDRQDRLGRVPGEVDGGGRLDLERTPRPTLASIGVLNRMVTGSVRPRPVENVVVNSAWVSGTIDGGRDRHGGGRPAGCR